MLAKLKATEINALIADYELLKGDGNAGLVQGALRLSAHVLAADADQFGSQATRICLSFTHVFDTRRRSCRRGKCH
jgi:hypothetical protein